MVGEYARIISELDTKPILVGHSLGGAIVQKLIEAGHGSAGVCINSGPPKGIIALDKDFLISNLLLTAPWSRTPTVLMSPAWYHRYVMNDLSAAQAEELVRTTCVPSGRKIARTIGRIDCAAPHAPLLFIAGGADRSQPPAVNRKNFAAYTHPTSVRAYKEFAARTHNTLTQRGWEEVAEYIANWLHELN